MARGASARSRAAALRHRLESAGLPASSRRAATEPGRDLAATACHTLRSLGPLFAAFAGYLGTRIDLVPLRDALALAHAPDGLPPSPPDIVTAALSAAGWSSDGAPALEPEPLRATAVHQWHRAWDSEGRQLWVQLVRPELERQLDQEWDLLGEVASRRLWGGPGRPADAEELTIGFAGWLEAQLDLEAAAATLERVREAAAAHGELDVATREPDWSGPSVAVSRLDDAEPVSGRLSGDTDLARRLAFAWLHLALLGGMCGHDLDPVEWVVRPGSRLGLLGGRFLELDRATRSTLLGALVAAAQHEPDRSGDLLRRLSESVDDDATRDRLRVSLRQAEPFRSAGWGDRYAGERLADVLFVHWRTAHSVGYRPRPRLQAFQRGFAQLYRMTRAVAPERDVLEQAMADLRVVAAAVEVRRQLAPSRAPHLVTRLLAAVEDVAHHGHDLGSWADAEPEEPREEAPARRWLVPLTLVAAFTAAGAVLETVVGGASGIATAVAVAAAVAWFAAAVERDLSHRPARKPRPGRPAATGGGGP